MYPASIYGCSTTGIIGSFMIMFTIIFAYFTDRVAAAIVDFLHLLMQ